MTKISTLTSILIFEIVWLRFWFSISWFGTKTSIFQKNYQNFIIWQKLFTKILIFWHDFSIFTTILVFTKITTGIFSNLFFHFVTAQSKHLGNIFEWNLTGREGSIPNPGYSRRSPWSFFSNLTRTPTLILSGEGFVSFFFDFSKKVLLKKNEVFKFYKKICYLTQNIEVLTILNQRAIFSLGLF